MTGTKGRRPAGSVLGIALAACLAGCGVVETARDGAGRVAVATGVMTTPPEPADFVRKTRPEEKDYIPVGVTPVKRDIAARSKGEVQALQAELEAQRQAHDALGGRSPPPPAPPKPVRAAAPSAAKPAVKPKTTDDEDDTN